uniref:Protein MAIN-LIKE 1-like n=1 Tax=Cicer arietinum TaxID=3827 RepID=A0A3Q7X6W3_CICAR|nr:protein MAIN-LIKE 1-like [Cicer arietinum]
MVGQFVKLKWLKDTFAHVPNNAAAEQVQQHCRAYLLRLIGGLVILDKSCNRVHLMYLPMLKYIQRVRLYSWGSACLANFYRQMCRATAPSYACMGGCTLLLQSWVWYRMPFISPHCTREISFPLAKRWISRGLIHFGTPYGDLVSYRSNIDHMQHYQFIWMHYRGLENVIPQQAYQDSMIWTAKTALICFSTVEWHQIDRVKLQFGLLQEIPDEPENIDTLHYQDMRGNHLENWKDKHAA